MGWAVTGAQCKVEINNRYIDYRLNIMCKKNIVLLLLYALIYDVMQSELEVNMLIYMSTHYVLTIYMSTVIVINTQNS